MAAVGQLLGSIGRLASGQAIWLRPRANPSYEGMMPHHGGAGLGATPAARVEAPPSKALARSDATAATGTGMMSAVAPGGGRDSSSSSSRAEAISLLKMAMAADRRPGTGSKREAAECYSRSIDAFERALAAPGVHEMVARALRAKQAGARARLSALRAKLSGGSGGDGGGSPGVDGGSFAATLASNAGGELSRSAATPLQRSQQPPPPPQPLGHSRVGSPPHPELQLGGAIATTGGSPVVAVTPSSVRSFRPPALSAADGPLSSQYPRHTTSSPSAALLPPPLGGAAAGAGAFPPPQLPPSGGALGQHLDALSSSNAQLQEALRGAARELVTKEQQQLRAAERLARAEGEPILLWLVIAACHHPSYS
eukprot:SAG25_NODE_156_length_13498_cov_313.643406_2_plen_368_part_00